MRLAVAVDGGEDVLFRWRVAGSELELEVCVLRREGFESRSPRTSNLFQRHRGIKAKPLTCCTLIHIGNQHTDLPVVAVDDNRLAPDMVIFASELDQQW